MKESTLHCEGRAFIKSPGVRYFFVVEMRAVYDWLDLICQERPRRPHTWPLHTIIIVMILTQLSACRCTGRSGRS